MGAPKSFHTLLCFTGLSQLIAHSIQFDVEDLSMEVHEAVGVELAAHSNAANGTSLRSGRLAPAQTLSLQLEDSGVAVLRRSGAAILSSEAALYDGNEADVDEPDGQGDCQDDDEETTLGRGLIAHSYSLGDTGERVRATLFDEHDSPEEDDEELGLGSLVATAEDVPEEWGEEDRLQGPDIKGKTVLETMACSVVDLSNSRDFVATADSARTRPDSAVMPRYHMDEHGNVLYEYEADYIEKKYEVFELRIIHRRHRTGFEETKDFPIRLNDLIAGRYVAWKSFAVNH